VALSVVPDAEMRTNRNGKKTSKQSREEKMVRVNRRRGRGMEMATMSP
jgi:hypothetical protein